MSSEVEVLKDPTVCRLFTRKLLPARTRAERNERGGVCVARPLSAHWNPLRPESHYNRLKRGELLTRWARLERKNVAVAKGQRSAALV